MIHKTTSRRRIAALASGALVAGGLVVAPAVAGLSAATAAPVSIKYACAGEAVGRPMTLPGTVTLEVTPPAAVLPGSDYSAAVTAKIELDPLPPTVPISELTGSFDIPFSVGGDSDNLKTPEQTVPTTALVYTGSGTLDLTAPTTLGDAPITVGTFPAAFSAMGGVVKIDAICTPAEGESLTVGTVTVAEDAPPPPVDVPVTGVVKVTGAAKVGKTLKAIPGVTDGATVAYQWLSNGKPIANATKPTLKLGKSLKGKKVSVQATYSKADFLDVVQTSKPVTVKK